MANRSPFVCRSTIRSVKSDTPSVLAIAEIAIAVIGYWVLWTRFGIHSHLWITIFVAPFLLLRSDASVKTGVKWAESYMGQRFVDANNIDRTLLIKVIVWGCIRPIVGVVATYYTLTRLLPIGSQLTDSLMGLGIGYLSGQFYMAITVAARPEELHLMTQKAIYVVIGTTIAVLAVLLTAVLAQRDLITSVSFVSGAILTIFFAGVIAARSHFFVDSFKQAEYPVQAVERLPASMTIFAPGVMLGGWIRSIAIRLLATLWHFREGLSSMPMNWWRTLFVYDMFVTPEIIPGYNRRDLYNVQYYFERIRLVEAGWRKFLYAICALLFFMPAYLYRLSIKSTFLLYYGLMFVVSGAQFAKRDIEISDLRDDPSFLVRVLRGDPRRRMRWIMIWGAVGFLAISNAFIILERSVELPFKLPFPIEYLVLIDYSSIKPWQVIGLLVAILTVVISYETKDLSIYLEGNGKTRPWLLRPIHRRARLVVCLLRLRNAASRMLMLVIAVHALLWLSPAQRLLPVTILYMLRQFYGDAMPPSPSAAWISAPTNRPAA
jgi:hypothetical protein